DASSVDLAPHAQVRWNRRRADPRQERQNRRERERGGLHVEVERTLVRGSTHAEAPLSGQLADVQLEHRIESILPLLGRGVHPKLRCSRLVHQIPKTCLESREVGVEPEIATTRSWTHVEQRG